MVKLLRGCSNPERRKLAYRVLTNKQIPIHRNEGYQPFFIVGSGRSGTSLLRKLLTNSDVHISPEIWRFKSVVNFFQSTNSLLSWDQIAHQVIAQFMVGSECTEEFRAKSREVVMTATRIPPEKRSLASLMSHFHEQNAQHKGNKCYRWGDKTPKNSFNLQQIDSVFPDAKYVHLVRDGADVAKSYVRAGLMPDLVSASQRWLSSIENVESFKRFKDCSIIEIRYERLVRDPHSVTSEVCSFLNIHQTQNLNKERDLKFISDLRTSNHHSNVFEPVTDRYIGKGRSSLTKKEKHVLKPLLNQKLQELGYKPL